MKSIFLLLSILFVNALNENLDKFFSDNVQFEFSYYGGEEWDKSADLSHQITNVYTPDNENYKCVLPQIELNQHKRVLDEYTGLSPLELLNPLFNKQCFWRSEGYWSYEFCPGKHIRQFHIEDKKTTLEYFLGYPSFDQEADAFDYQNAQKVEYAGDQVLYYPLNFLNGTKCDLKSGEPRSTKVLLVCSNEGTSNSFVSITETQSCHYELLFATNYLCEHYAFQRPKPNRFEIKCFLDVADDKNTRLYSRPQLYNQFANDESFKDFTQVLNRRAGLQYKRKSSFFDMFTTQKATSSTEKATRTQQKPAERKAKKLPISRKLLTFERLTLEMTEKQAKRPLEDIMLDFFELSYCFVGVSQTGYKIKFCYRSKITIYTEDPKTGDIVDSYVIGKYNEKFQEVFAKHYPEKIKTYDEEEIIDRVTNLYPYGEPVDESEKETNVEIRFICNLEELNSALNIKMFFSEPKAGEYRLYLESGLLCEYMERMDKFGIYRNAMELFVLETLQNIRQKDVPASEVDFEFEDDMDLDEAIQNLMEMDEFYSNMEEQKEEEKKPGEYKKPEKEL